MKQGEIWLVEFPDGVGHEYNKNRPALVIESDIQLNRTNIITVIPLTSQITNCLSEDISVPVDTQNKLFVDSILKVHHINSFDPSRFIKKFGNISADILLQVKNYLKIHFAL